jgi:hypothetical protein
MHAEAAVVIHFKDLVLEFKRGSPVPVEELTRARGRAASVVNRLKALVSATAPPQPPPGLNPTESRIWEVLAAGPKQAQTIADEVSRTVAHTRSVLAGLKKRGLVVKTWAGYQRGEIL